MQDEQHSAPIIVIKKKGGYGGHHGGAWKVAYADFVTAMMSLFIVLWLMSSSEKTQKAIGGYFQDPKGYGKQIGSTLAGNGEALSLSKTDMADIKNKIEEAMKRAPDFKALRDHIQVTVTGEGLRIELLETQKGMFFDSGSSKPSEFGEDLLARLAVELGKLPNRILLEGHTDSKPFNSRTDYSNWELSSDRANAARRLMQNSGLRADQVSSVRGYADQQLRNPKDATDPSNRRITVIVQYMTGSDKEKSIGAGGDKAKGGAAEGEHKGAEKPGPPGQKAPAVESKDKGKQPEPVAMKPSPPAAKPAEKPNPAGLKK